MGRVRSSLAIADPYTVFVQACFGCLMRLLSPEAEYLSNLVKLHPMFLRPLAVGARVSFRGPSKLKFRWVHFSAEPPASPPPLLRLTHKDWLSPTEVLRIFSDLHDPTSLLSVLDEYSNRKDYNPTESFFTLVIQKLALAHDFDSIDRILATVRRDKPCRLTEDFFFGVIKIYGHSARRIKKAIETLNDMPKYGCWPTVKSFNFVLNLLVSGKFFETVHEVFLSAPKLGVEIDACSLNILIKGLCENGKLESAFQVLDEFPKQGCRPNVRTFSTLMHGLCEQGKIDEAFKLMEKMEGEGIEPDTITFNILISGLRNKGRIQEAVQLLKTMEMKGCDPNPGSYQQVLYALIDDEKLIEAKEYMAKMISIGFSPSFVSYKKLIHGLCKKRLLGDVEWALAQMVKHDFLPKMGMWKQMVHCVFAESRVYNHVCFDDIFCTER